MAFFFGDGFDLYSTITDCGSYWDAAFGGTATLALSASGRFAGSRSVACSGTASNTAYITKTSGSNDAVHHISLSLMQTTALSGSTGFYFTLFDGTTAQCTVAFTSAGNLLLVNGGILGTTIATYTGAIAATNTWYQFEIEIVINSTTGSIAVRKNGNITNDFSATALNTRGSTNNYANKLAIGSNANITPHTIDDLLWRSDASSVPWVGDIRCFTRMPASDASVAWSRSGTIVPVTPYAQASTLANGANSGRYVSFTAPCTGTIGTVTAPVTTAQTANVKCSIFASSGTAPTTALGSATPVTNAGVGTATWTFSTPVAVSQGTQYWVGICADAASGVWGASSGAVGLAGTATYAAFPIANPTGLSTLQTPAYTITITPTSATNAPFVADIQQDGATTYVYSSTVSQSDLYGIAAIGSTPSSIVGVVTRGYFEKSDAGTRNVAVQLQSGATNVQSASTALNTVWGWVSRTDLVDPATGSAWTAVGVSNATIGAVVTA